MAMSTPEELRSLLDDLATMRRIDVDDMMGLVTEFPTQCHDAVRIGAGFQPPTLSNRPIDNIVVTGLGGSAIGGDLLRCLVDADGDAPLIVNRDYSLPGFVGRESLVIAASYSGSTEETIAAYEQARVRRAQVVCVTSGGELAERAQADEVPVCLIPGGQPPRASTGYMFFPMLYILIQRGLFYRALSGDMDETLLTLERLRVEYGPETPLERNPAKQLALALHGRLPVFYGAHSYSGVVAYRWKCQFNENGKLHAFANVFPEMNHNEILAWTNSATQAGNWTVVYLRDPQERAESTRIGRRVEITRDIIGQAADNHEVWAVGKSLLCRMFSLMFLGDCASVYAAYLAGSDPTAIPGIEQLKLQMSQT